MRKIYSLHRLFPKGIIFFFINLLLGGNCFGQATDLIISEYGEGSSGNSKYIELYNGTGAALNLTNFRIALYANGAAAATATANLSGTLANGATYVIGNNSGDVPGANTYLSGPMSFNGDDAVALVKNISSTWTVIDVVGQIGNDPGTGWPVAGTANATVDRRLTRKATVCSPNTNWTASAGTNTTNSEWIVGSAYSSGAAVAGHTQTCTVSSEITTTAITAGSYPVISGGEGITVGSGTLNAKGVIWGLTNASVAALPTPSATNTEGRWHIAATGNTAFTAPLAGVQPGTTIYYRAYFTTASPVATVLGDIKTYVVPSKGTSLAFWNFGPDGAGYTLNPTTTILSTPTLTPTTATGTYDTNGKDGFIYNGVARGQALTWDDVTAPTSTNFVLRLNTTGYGDIHFRADYLAQVGGTYTLAYSTNGTSYTNITTTGSIPTNMTVAGDENYNWGTIYHDLSSIAAFDNAPDIYLRLTLNSGVIDQFQVDNIHFFGTALAPEMNVQGNGVIIADGDNTPSLTDYTDFGSVCIAGTTSVTRTFTIQNPGTGPLNLTGASPYVVVTGAGFTLTANPTTPVAASGSTTFQVTFDPAVVGANAGTISIANNDADENPYNFSISGTGIDVPAQPGTITGIVTPVCQDVSQPYSIAAVSGATGYTWTLPAGWTGTSTTTSITAMPGTTSGTIAVTANNTCGSSAARVSANVTVNPSPAIPAGTISGTTPACTTTTLTISSSAPAGETYYWQTTATGTSTANAGSSYAAIATGTYSVRARNNTTLCWSTATAGFAVSIVSAASITTHPANTTVTAPNTATFTAAGSGYTGLQWQVNSGSGWANVPAVGPYSGTTGLSLTINPTNISLDGNSYRLAFTGNSPCGIAYSNAAELTVEPGPCFAEGFETGLPTSYNATTSYNLSSGTWTGQANGVIRGTTGVNSGSYSLQLRSQTGAQVTTPALTSGVGTVSFWASASTSSGSMQVNYSTDGGGTWLPATGSPFSLSLSSTQYTATINSPAPNILVQFYRTAATVYVDDIELACFASCTHTISSFAPASGPVGTLVTIQGTGFTPTSTVNIGGVASGAVTFVNSTTLIAEVPAGAETGAVTVMQSGCPVSSPGFTIIAANNCSSGSGNATDLFISEVYDAATGSLSYVEIFNGTTGSIALANYTIRITTNGSTDTDYPMTGNLASGAVYILRIGTSSTGTCTGITINNNQSTAGGINGNDEVFLLKNGTVLDYAPNPNATGAGGTGSNFAGFNQVRRATVTAPSASYTAAQWDELSPESCGHIGVAPFVPGGSSVTVNPNPSDFTACSTPLSFTTNSTGSGTGTNAYLWKVYNPLTNAWVNASELSTNTASFGLSTTITTTATNTASMTVNGNVAQLLNYQFYAQITRGGCVTATNAAQYIYATKPYYRALTNIATPGEWTNPANWEMSDFINTGFAAACSYPIALNSVGVIIPAGKKILHSSGHELNIDRLEIAEGGEFEIVTNSKLDILNGTGTNAPDLIVNGTLIDRAQSGSGIVLNRNVASALDAQDGTWTMGYNAVSGVAGTIIKSYSSSSTQYGFMYRSADGTQGIASIPAQGNWIYRRDNTGIADMTFASSDGNGGAMFYPNLTIENVVNGNTYSSTFNAGTPSLSEFTMLGSQPVTVKGNLDIGGTGTGFVNFLNINSNPGLLAVAGNMTVRTGNTFRNNGNATNNGSGIDVKGSLTVNGNLTNNGGTVQTGMLRFSGSAAQVVSGTGVMNLENVEIANPAASSTGVDVQRNFSIPGVLSFGGANPRLTLTSGLITLNSSAARTASVGIIPSATIISYGTGRFETERYINYVGNWNLAASPTAEAQSIAQAWQEGTPGSYVANGYGTRITGPGANPATNGLDQTSVGYSLKSWNSVTNQWNNVQNTLQITPDSLVNRNTGYFIFVRGDRGTGAGATGSSTTLRSQGKLYVGNTIEPLSTRGPVVTYPAALNLPSGRFISVANPFASTIDFTLISKTNIKNRFSLWDPVPNGNYGVGAYLTFSSTAWEPTPTPVAASPYYGLSANTLIQSGQAFMVETDIAATNTAINFSNGENTKVAGSRTVMRDPQNPATLVMMSTMLHNANNNLVADGNRVVMDAAYSNEVGWEDARKIINSGENFAVKVNSDLLIVEGRQPIVETDTIFYNMSNLRTQNYTLSFEPRNLGSTGLIAELVDQYLNSRTPVSLSDSTLYNFTATADAASKAANRFMLVFRSPSGPLPVTFVSIAAQRQPDRSVKVNWEVANEVNIEKYEVQRSADGQNFTGILTNDATNSRQYTKNDVSPLAADNFYRIKAIGLAGDVTYSAIVKVPPDKQPGLIVVQPNPVKNKQLNIRFSNQPAGDYALQLTNTIGQVIYTGTATVSNNAQVRMIALPSTVAAGNYQLAIRSKAGESVYSETIIIE